jgi:hypothetical protein
MERADNLKESSLPGNTLTRHMKRWVSCLIERLFPLGMDGLITHRSERIVEGGPTAQNVLHWNSNIFCETIARNTFCLGGLSTQDCFPGDCAVEIKRESGVCIRLQFKRFAARMTSMKMRLAGPWWSSSRDGPKVKGDVAAQAAARIVSQNLKNQLTISPVCQRL